MKKVIKISLFFIISVTLCLIFAVFSSADGNLPHVIDNGKLISTEQCVELEKMIDNVSENEKNALNKPYVPNSYLITAIVIVLILSISIAAITLVMMIKSMNNARPRKTAREYVKHGSFNITVSRDMYLYSTVVKMPRVQPNKKSGGGGKISFGGGGRGGRF